MAIAKVTGFAVVCVILVGGAYYSPWNSGSTVETASVSEVPGLQVRERTGSQHQPAMDAVDAGGTTGGSASSKPFAYSGSTRLSGVVVQSDPRNAGGDSAAALNRSISDAAQNSAANIYSARRLADNYISSLPTPPESMVWGSPQHIAWSKEQGSLSYIEKSIRLKGAGVSSVSPGSARVHNPYQELKNSGGIFDLIDSSTAPNASSEEELIDAHRALQAQSYLDKVSQIR